MAFELNAYILHKLHNNEELPRTIIWQHTDCFRNHVIDYKYSGSWKPNRLDSLLSKLNQALWVTDEDKIYKNRGFARRFVKLNSFGGYHMMQKYKKDTPENAEELNAWGMGSKLVHRVPKFFKRKYGSSIQEFPIGDSHFVVQHFQHAINIYNLQLLCKSLNIRLVNYNYFSFGTDLSQDPIIKQIDKSDYVLNDFLSNWGMYNHLMWKGFSQPDKYHFDEAAHLYQAEVLYDYIVNNKQLDVEQANFLQDEENKVPIFDYVDEIGNRRIARHVQKETLLKKIFEIK